MPETKKQLSQIELFEKAFLDIKKDVTKEDRENCAVKLLLSKVTINRYVIGQVYDNDTAYKILNSWIRKLKRGIDLLNNCSALKLRSIE